MTRNTLKKPITIGIIGYGRTAEDLHVPGIGANPDLQIISVCDILPERRAKAKDRLDCKVYQDYQTLLSESRPDLVCVLTRNNQHAGMAVDVLRSGSHVLVTKPMATDRRGADEMIAAATRADRLLLPWLPARWGYDFRSLKALIGDGRVGRVFQIRRSVTGFGLRDDWQTQKAHGGGYLLNWGAHIVDPPLLLADSEPVSVSAHMAHIMTGGDAEDLFTAWIELENGVLVQTEYTLGVQKLPSWVVQGDRGTVIVRDNRLRCESAEPVAPGSGGYSGGSRSLGPPLEEELTGALYGDSGEIYEDVAKAVRGESPFPVTPESARRVIAVLDAIRMASEQRRLVSYTEVAD